MRPCRGVGRQSREGEGQGGQKQRPAEPKRPCPAAGSYICAIIKNLNDRHVCRIPARSRAKRKEMWKCIAHVGWMRSIPRPRYRCRRNPPGSCSKLATKNGSRATFYAHAIKSQTHRRAREVGMWKLRHCSQAAANADGLPDFH